MLVFFMGPNGCKSVGAYILCYAVLFTFCYPF